MPMTCEEVWKEISNYIDGEVDPALRAELDAHFIQCRPCAAVLNGARNVIRLASDQRAFQTPSGFGDRVNNFLSIRLSREHAAALMPRKMSVQTWGASALAACLAVAVWTGATMRDRAIPTPKSQHSEPAVKIIPAMVAIDEQGKTFHVPTCPYLHGKHKLVSVETAIREGYVPCVRCEQDFLAA